MVLGSGSRPSTPHEIDTSEFEVSFIVGVDFGFELTKDEVDMLGLIVSSAIKVGLEGMIDTKFSQQVKVVVKEGDDDVVA